MDSGGARTDREILCWLLSYSAAQGKTTPRQAREGLPWRLKRLGIHWPNQITALGQKRCNSSVLVRIDRGGRCRDVQFFGRGAALIAALYARSA